MDININAMFPIIKMVTEANWKSYLEIASQIVTILGFVAIVIGLCQFNDYKKKKNIEIIDLRIAHIRNKIKNNVAEEHLTKNKIKIDDDDTIKKYFLGKVTNSMASILYYKIFGSHELKNNMGNLLDLYICILKKEQLEWEMIATKREKKERRKKEKEKEKTRKIYQKIEKKVEKMQNNSSINDFLEQNGININNNDEIKNYFINTANVSLCSVLLFKKNKYKSYKLYRMYKLYDTYEKLLAKQEKENLRNRM